MNRETELVYFAHPPGWAAFDLSALDDRSRVSSGWTSLVSPVDGSILEVGTEVLHDGVTIQVGRSSHVRDELLAHFRARAMEVGAALVLAAVLGGLLIAYVALAPVRSMEATTQAILETRRFDARVVTRGTRDPLDQLGARINEMLGQIQTLLTGMRGALDNVAHDLRTPLTRFRNVAELALIEADPAQGPRRVGTRPGGGRQGQRHPDGADGCLRGRSGHDAPQRGTSPRGADRRGSDLAVRGRSRRARHCHRVRD